MPLSLDTVRDRAFLTTFGTQCGYTVHLDNVVQGHISLPARGFKLSLSVFYLFIQRLTPYYNTYKKDKKRPSRSHKKINKIIIVVVAACISRILNC